MIFNLWVCKKCFKAKPRWRMACLRRYTDVYSWNERLHLCKNCYGGMIMYPTKEVLKEYR